MKRTRAVCSSYDMCQTVVAHLRDFSIRFDSHVSEVAAPVAHRSSCYINVSLSVSCILYFFIVLTSCAIIYSSISQHYTQIFTFVFFYLCHCIKAPRRTKSFSELKILYNTVTPLLLFMGRNFLN